MRFKIDENLHDDVALLFASQGHDAHTVHVEGLRGCDDATLAEHCRADNRAIVTLDLDFADIRVFLLEREPVAGRLWIVSAAGVRIRGG
jgi:predicted nuclease of predicted toxin-antitoxin system